MSWDALDRRFTLWLNRLPGPIGAAVAFIFCCTIAVVWALPFWLLWLVLALTS